MRLIDLDNPDVVFCGHDGDYLRYNIWEELPTVDAVPVVRGEWKETPTGWIYCSACGSEPPEESNYKSNYCPHCGAKMMEVQE